jgi:hypothetical protein
MKKLFFNFSLFFLLPLSLPVANAYDINTHTAMTSEAIKLSVITASPNTSPLFKRLHLRDKDYAIGEHYIDIGSLIKRNATPFERKVMENVGDTLKTGLTVPAADSIPGWILRGAIREDDNSIETPSGTPQGDEPGGVFDRVFGHFHDPVQNRGLTVRGNNVGPVAADWATNKNATVSGFGFGSRKNYYNLPSAREAMWRALTLKSWDNGVLGDDVDPTNWSPPNKEALRHAYWATMFRAVGDVVHIVQDMGQPQHTRNDPHGGLGCVPGTNVCAGGHASFIENYMKSRTLGADFFQLNEGLFSVPDDGKPIRIKSVQLQYSGYTKPMFAKAEDFFISATGAGLANYSNRGFYSFGTNISSLVGSYPSPSPTGAGLVPLRLNALSSDPNLRPKNMVGKVIHGATITFLTGNVIDSAGGANESNVKLTTTGYWDQFLGEQSTLRQYTLNHYNYDDQARLLIPRAVAYSAGLIDYFFRGSLKISAPDEGVFGILDHSLSADNCKNDCGFKKVKLKLANTTPDISISGGGIAAQNMTGGTVVAVAKFRKNTCYTTDLNGEYDSSTDSRSVTQYVADCRSAEESITVSQPLTVAAIPRCDPASTSSPTDCEQKATPLTFNFDNPIPINATDLYLQVVYRGTLGDEADAVVVETLDIAEPTYYLIVNNTDYLVCYNGAWYYKNPDGSLPSTIPPITNSGIIGGVFQSRPYASWLVSFQPNEGNLYTKRVAQVNNLAPKEYARFAILIEKGRRYNNAIAGYTSPVPPPYTLIGTAVHKTEYAANGNSTDYLTNYKGDSTIRQLKANIPLFGYEPYSDPTPGQSCTGVDLPPPPTNPAYTKPTVMKPVALYFPD